MFYPGYGSNGFKGYGGEPIRGKTHASDIYIYLLWVIYFLLWNNTGYASAHGNAGLGLGHRFGNERTKGPMQGVAKLYALILWLAFPGFN